VLGSTKETKRSERVKRNLKKDMKEGNLLQEGIFLKSLEPYMKLSLIGYALNMIRGKSSGKYYKMITK
jgi:hypothetical protein